MRTFVGSQEACNAIEFAQLAVGIDAHEDFRELFVGHEDETPYEGAVRADVARAVLADLREEAKYDEIAREDAEYAEELFTAGQLLRRAIASARMPWKATAV